MKTKETFASLIDSFQYHYDLSTVFDDFLTMSVASCGRNVLTGLSYDEDLYLKIIARYKDDDLRHNFPKMFATLTLEMTERMLSKEGTDVLGEFYEARLQKQGLSQFFTPYPICEFMARIAIGEAQKIAEERPMRILDPACGSGRMLMVAAHSSEKKHEYYGIDIDLTCVKMSALNLFLSGIFNSEVMCANALLPNEFRGSYLVSFLPFGIFRIEEKEKSLLWHLVNNKTSNNNSNEITEGKPPKEYEWGKGNPLGSQLEFF
ncbi:MAG TPA: N-6 DNA methylase [Chitinophagales bacterium]|nr:N-6 DNA methylase [Chitinophagales bacterium]